MVLRNLEQIELGVEKDIDLLVHPKDLAVVERNFREVAMSHEAILLTKNVGLGGLQVVAAFPNITEEKPVQIHLVTYLTIKTDSMRSAVPGLSTKIAYHDIATEEAEILGNRIMVPASIWALLLSLQRLMVKPGPRYSGLVLDNLDAISDDELRQAVHHSVAKAEYGNIPHLSKRLLLSLGTRGGHIPAVISAVGQTLSSMFRRKGIIVIFSGPDGAGKSTSTGICVSFLKEQLGLKVRHVKGLTLGSAKLNPAMMEVHKRLRGVPISVNNAKADLEYRDRQPNKGVAIWKARRLAGLLSYIVQYYPAYALARWRNLMGVTVVVDTSVFDRFVKSHRPRFRWLENWVVPILPAGDVIFQLKADPVAINLRKPELTVMEIKEYYEVMNNIISCKSSAIRVIDTGTGVDAAAQIMKAELLHKLSRVTER